MRRISDVLPAPDGPVRNWNERGSMSKAEIAQDFRPDAVAQADILEPDQCRLGLAIAGWLGIECRKLRIKTLLTIWPPEQGGQGAIG